MSPLCNRTPKGLSNRSWAIVALFVTGVAVAGCTADVGLEPDASAHVGDTAAPEPTGDAVSPEDQGGPVRIVDAAAPPESDAAPPPPPDDATAPPMPDAAVDECSVACDRALFCAAEVCEGLDEAGAESLRRSCSALCLGNPAFAIVVSGSETCDDVVAFLLDRGAADPAITTACPPPAPPPPMPDGGECRFPCGDGEVCTGGHCVRLDGTCAGDIHCRFGTQRCGEGLCVAAEFAPCRGDDTCAVEQFCLLDPANPLAEGVCVFDCRNGEACPFHERCFPEYGGLCYYETCGASTANGEPGGECRIGGRGGHPGTCFPLPASSGEGVGVCLEAGLAAEGEMCDLQVEGRDPAARAVQCAPGSYCWGDFDDDALPPDTWMQTGECAGLCDPRHPVCSEGRTCLDLSNGDDPATPEDDTRYLGICLRLECALFPAPDAPPDCEDGSACRLVAVGTSRGDCGRAGAAGRFEPCQTHEECAGISFCGEAGGPTTVCNPLCDPGANAEPCAEAERCYAEPGWVVGFCVPVAGE